jgi:hypothetical protein
MEFVLGHDGCFWRKDTTVNENKIESLPSKKRRWLIHGVKVGFVLVAMCKA